MTERYEIIATLLTASPLAIHGGFSSHDLKAMGHLESGALFRAKADGVHEGLEDCDALVVRDWRGLPYIPGSSLKGVIREYLERDKKNAKLVKSLLGTASSASSDDRDDRASRGGRGGEGGCVTFEDAFLDLAPCNESEVSTLERYSPKGTDRDQERANQWKKWEAAVREGSDKNDEIVDFATKFWNDEKCFPGQPWRAQATPPRLLTNARLLPYWSSRTLTYIEQHSSVDRRTGTVHHGALYSEEVVPTGLPFVVRMLYEPPKSEKTDEEQDTSATVSSTGGNWQADVELLLQALASFNLDPIHAPPQLGSNTRHGWGLMTCLPSTVQVLRWTPDGNSVLPGGNDAPWKPTDVIQGTLQSPRYPRRPRIALEIELCFSTPFVTLDPAKGVIGEGIQQGVYDKNASDDRPERKGPDHVPRVVPSHKGIETERNRTSNPAGLTGIPLLPAAGFKGALRSQLEKILRTIHPGIHVSPHGQLEPVKHDQSPPFVRHLLGLESQQSGLWCSDFVGQGQLRLNRREMVAIDRFSGGVSGSAKFNLLYFQSPTLSGSLVLELPTAEEMQRLDSSRMPDVICREHPEMVCQMLGAMVLVLRDLLEGDIAFGFGDRKGFGQCTARIRKIQQEGLSRIGIGCDLGEGESHSSSDWSSPTKENLNETSPDQNALEVLSNEWLARVLKEMEEMNKRTAIEETPAEPIPILLEADHVLNTFLTSVRELNAFTSRSAS